MITKATIRMDEERHRYYLTMNGVERPVPGVTQIIKATLGMSFKASDWYLGRGKACHACYALLAQGKQFECAPECQGFVDSWRVWAKDHKVRPVAWELMVFSELYQYAGQLDLVAYVDGKLAICDYKGTLDDRAQWQLGGYSIAHDDHGLPPLATGLGVELHEDGSLPKMRWFDLKRPIQEFKSLRTVYGIKQRLGEVEEETISE